MLIDSEGCGFIGTKVGIGITKIATRIYKVKKSTY